MPVRSCSQRRGEWLTTLSGSSPPLPPRHWVLESDAPVSSAAVAPWLSFPSTSCIQDALLCPQGGRGQEKPREACLLGHLGRIRAQRPRPIPAPLHPIPTPRHVSVLLRLCGPFPIPGGEERGYQGRVAVYVGATHTGSRWGRAGSGDEDAASGPCTFQATPREASRQSSPAREVPTASACGPAHVFAAPGACRGNSLELSPHLPEHRGAGHVPTWPSVRPRFPSGCRLSWNRFAGAPYMLWL